MAPSARLDIIGDDFDIGYFRETSLTKRSKERGYSYFILGYIFSVITCSIGSAEVDVRCKSYRSMRKSEAPHTVNITVKTDEKRINASHCTCVAGSSGTCAHVVGLIHTLSHYKKMGLKEVPADLSVTSLPQQWHKPRGSKLKAAPVVSMVMAKPTDPSSRKRKPVSTTLGVQRVEPVNKTQMLDLKAQTGTPLSYLLTTDPDMEETHLGPMQFGSCLNYHLQNYSSFGTTSNQAPTVTSCGITGFPLAPHVVLEDNDIFLNQFNSITLQSARDLEQRTVKQSDTKEWYDARNNRITASQFPKIQKRKKSINEPFVKDILFQPVFQSKPTSYGKFNEENAKKAYVNNNISCHVHDCGFVVNPNMSFLGATPDGKVCDNGQTGIMEIKCPYSARDMDLIAASNSLPSFCLSIIDNKLTINKSHDHSAKFRDNY